AERQVQCRYQQQAAEFRQKIQRECHIVFKRINHQQHHHYLRQKTTKVLQQRVVGHPPEYHKRQRAGQEGNARQQRNHAAQIPEFVHASGPLCERRAAYCIISTLRLSRMAISSICSRLISSNVLKPISRAAIKGRISRRCLYCSMVSTINSAGNTKAMPAVLNSSWLPS